MVYWSKLERDDVLKMDSAVGRDDENDFYLRGFEHGRKGWNRCPPTGKASKRTSYERGYLAGYRPNTVRS